MVWRKDFFLFRGLADARNYSLPGISSIVGKLAGIYRLHNPINLVYNYSQIYLKAGIFRFHFLS